MNILLTNDDGINSEGLQKLAEVLRIRLKHRVFVIAPDTNRSGISHAISLINGPVRLCAAGNDTWSCSGLPVDCVMVGVLGEFPVKPDLVLSGINQGANMGTDLIFSGTAAGARQASLLGVPGIALSLDGNSPYFWDMAVKWTADHLDELLAFHGEDSFINVNIPNKEDGPLGIISSWPGVKNYNGKVKVSSDRDGSCLCELEPGKEKADEEDGTDCDVTARNYVSVSSIVNHPAILGDFCSSAPSYAAVTRRDRNRNSG